MEPGRRTRISAEVDPQLKAWLHKTVYVHAHLLTIVRLYGSPDRAGGRSLAGETYQARASRGDKTLLHDCLTVAIEALTAIREDVGAAIESVDPTEAQPGTPEKVAEMVRRAERGESLFVDGDGLRRVTGVA